MGSLSGIKAKKTHVGAPEHPKNVALKKLAQRHVLSDSILLVEMTRDMLGGMILTGRLAIALSLPRFMQWGNVIAHKVHVCLNMLPLLFGKRLQV